MRACRRCVGLAVAVLLVTAPARGGDWRDDVSRAPAGGFPALPDIRMTFRFGWSNVLEAGEAEAKITRVDDSYRTRVTGGSLGLARALWPLDAEHVSSIRVGTLQPERLAQTERYRKRTIETRVRFDAAGLERQRKTSESKGEAKWKRVNFAPIFDVIGGVLYVRSQPLRVGDQVGVVAFPGDSPYLAVARVERRETIRCMGRDWPALRLSLTLRKLDVKNKQPTEAVSYAKFQSGTFWVSDDDLRIPLRAEVNIFVGFIYGELVEYELRGRPAVKTGP